MDNRKSSGCPLSSRVLLLLEHKLAGKLENARIVCGSCCQEGVVRTVLCTIAGIGVDRAPLSMVKDVKSLRSKFEVHGVAHCEVLEQAHIVLCASRHSENVSTGVAIRQP